MKNRTNGCSRSWQRILAFGGSAILIGALCGLPAPAQFQPPVRKPAPQAAPVGQPQLGGGQPAGAQPLGSGPQTAPAAAPAEGTSGRTASPRTRRSSWLQRQLGRINWVYAAPVAAVGGVLLLLLLMRLKGEGRAAPPTVSSDVIGGYRLQNLMMTGQTSQVWEAVELASSRHFAMKLLLPEKAQDPEHRELLFHEAAVGMALAHPNVIRMIKLDKNEFNPYIVMEFFPAGNLKLRIMHKKWDFIKERALDIAKQTATGLAYMNASGWVHRDVKPDNILVNSAGEVRIIDFALAQRIAKKKGLFRRRRRQSKTAGTRSYMSPEQVRGEPLDGRADIYSFGVSCFEMVTGRPPFRAATPGDLLRKQLTQKPESPQVYNPDVTDEFAAFVLRMLAKKPEDRPKDFHEVLMKLRNMYVFKSQKSQPAQRSQ